MRAVEQTAVSKIRSASGKEENTYELDELTHDEDTVLSEDPEDDENDCEMDSADWPLRVDARNNPNHKERQEHEATLISFRDS